MLLLSPPVVGRISWVGSNGTDRQYSISFASPITSEGIKSIRGVFMWEMMKVVPVESCTVVKPVFNKSFTTRVFPLIDMISIVSVFRTTLASVFSIKDVVPAVLEVIDKGSPDVIVSKILDDTVASTYDVISSHVDMFDMKASIAVTAADTSSDESIFVVISYETTPFIILVTVTIVSTVNEEPRANDMASAKMIFISSNWTSVMIRPTVSV